MKKITALSALSLLLMGSSALAAEAPIIDHPVPTMPVQASDISAHDTSMMVASTDDRSVLDVLRHRPASQPASSASSDSSLDDAPLFHHKKAEIDSIKPTDSSEGYRSERDLETREPDVPSAVAPTGGVPAGVAAASAPAPHYHTGQHLRYEVRSIFVYEGPNHEQRRNRKIPAWLSQSHDNIDEAVDNIKPDWDFIVDSSVMKRDNDETVNCLDETKQSFSAHSVSNYDIGSPKTEVSKYREDTDETTYFHPSAENGDRVTIEGAVEKTVESYLTLHHDKHAVRYGSAHIDVPNGQTLVLDTSRNGPIIDGVPLNVDYKLESNSIAYVYREHHHDAVESRNYKTSGQAHLILNRVNVISLPYSHVEEGYTILFIKPVLVD